MGCLVSSVLQELQSPLFPWRGGQGWGRVAGTAAGLRLPRAGSVPSGHPEIPTTLISFLKLEWSIDIYVCYVSSVNYISACKV